MSEDVVWSGDSSTGCWNMPPPEMHGRLVECRDLPLYDDLPLPMVFVQGWFNDQDRCFNLFRSRLTDDEQIWLFSSADLHESAKAKYKTLWYDGEFKACAKERMGEHKRLDLLNSGKFAYWAQCVFNEVAKTGSMEALLETLGDVEVAHDRFKPWLRAKAVRVLNAADAARILARYGYLEPEQRPLLARGALRGAAIHLNGEPPSKRVDQLEKEYAEESRRVSLEEKAAAYIDECTTFSRFGKFKMEEGENWFCEEIHKNHKRR